MSQWIVSWDHLQPWLITGTWLINDNKSALVQTVSSSQTQDPPDSRNPYCDHGIPTSHPWHCTSTGQDSSNELDFGVNPPGDCWALVFAIFQKPMWAQWANDQDVAHVQAKMVPMNLIKSESAQWLLNYGDKQMNGQTDGDNRMAWQWAETLVEIMGTLADIRGTTK